MKRRIAFAVHDARPGGGQDRYALELVNGLAQRHDVTLFACSASGLDPRVRFERIAVPRRPALLRARVFARRTRRRLRGASWDIVHTVGGALPGARVITAQFCQAGWGEAATRWPSALVGRAERAYRRLETALATGSERRAAGSPQLRALIGVSRRTAAEWRSAYGTEAPVLEVIPNGADLEVFRPAAPGAKERFRRAHGLPPDARVLLLVGALVRKGIETALAALAALPPEVHLVAVGAGPHARVTALARRLGVGDRLRLAAPVSAIERFYHGADVFLFPTRYEPFGMVVLEAWASGLPVVASGVTGALEWATPDEHALVVADPADAPGFAAAARRVLNEPALAATLADRGRALARGFGWERVVTATEAVYAAVLGGAEGTVRP